METSSHSLLHATNLIVRSLLIIVIVSHMLLNTAFNVYAGKVYKPSRLYLPTKGAVWPRPQYQHNNRTYYKLHPSVFNFTIKGNSCPTLVSAIERYAIVLRRTHRIAWKHMKQSRQLGYIDLSDRDYRGIITELQINVRSPCEQYPHLDMDEMYGLNVSAVATLTSHSIWGALRGLETFVQLFYLSEDYKTVFINGTYIMDYPRYAHRGILIDTSRHYITVPNIMKTLDAMEMNKMNVLHWHIVDDQSFPYQSEKFYLISAQGSYQNTMVYSKSSIKSIVNYARDRGIRILPEFDLPGHKRLYDVPFPEILTECYEDNRKVGFGPMNPIKNITYKLIRELFQEMRQLFPDNYVHVGGDEVDYSCCGSVCTYIFRQSNHDVMAFATKRKMRDLNELHAFFLNRALPMIDQFTPIVWQEIFDEHVKLPNSTVVQVWKHADADTLIRILRTGHKIIYSSSWYLDENAADWIKFYRADPRRIVRNTNVNTIDIIGGEACLWGKVVSDRNLLSRVWPRASAVAEKLWSAEPESLSYYSLPPRIVFRRIEEHVCRMNRRGFYAQPPNGPSACIFG